jgi:osomolarity two-component system response regulator SKN7
MEQPGQYTSRHQLFQPPQLPPPSQLHLPVCSSFSHSNTLPPISNIPSTSSQNIRFPIVSPYASSHNLQPSSPTSQHAWPSVHRTSSSRDEIHPHHAHSDSSRHDPSVKRESGQPLAHPNDYQHQSHGKDAGGPEDGMNSTSDFVKKLYKSAISIFRVFSS